jgi:hypothetical protein
MRHMTPDLNTVNGADVHSSIRDKWRICDQLAQAVDAGHVGEIVSKHEKLILDYYKDVLEQAQKSFASAGRSWNSSPASISCSTRARRDNSARSISASKGRTAIWSPTRYLKHRGQTESDAARSGVHYG